MNPDEFAERADGIITRIEGKLDSLDTHVEQLYELKETYRLVLGLAMYREKLNDTARDGEGWPGGVETNLGELDYAAETLIRSAWEELPFEERGALLSDAATVVREFLARKEGSDGP
jgi:hypothetical protein